MNNSNKQTINDIMKAIKSLEKRGISLKRATKKRTSHERGFLNFFGH